MSAKNGSSVVSLVERVSCARITLDITVVYMEWGTYVVAVVVVMSRD